MSRFVNGAVIGIVSFIALVSAFWYTAELKRPEQVRFSGLSGEWGDVDDQRSEIRFSLGFYNPHEANIDLVRLEQQILINGNPVDWEYRNVTIRLAPQSNRSIPLTVEFPNSFLSTWWTSHVKQGEESRMVVRGTATFMALQRLVTVPYDWEATWSTSLVASAGAALRTCEPETRTPCIESSIVSWDDESPPNLRVHLAVRNPGDSVVWMRNWSTDLLLQDVEMAATQTIQGPIELGPQGSHDLDLTFRVGASALASWWPKHVAECERSTLVLPTSMAIERFVNASYSANSTQDTTEPATGQLVIDTYEWVPRGPPFTTGFVCART